VLPWLALSTLAVLAIASAWAAFRLPGTPVLPVFGLLWLALPVMASLQFYAGYPLRLVTAHCSAWLLQAIGLAAEARGAGVLFDGRWVLVDAPCCGVQLAWLACCTAATTALWSRLPDACFLRRLPGVGLAVLAGNVARNTLRAAGQGGALMLPDWGHEAVGLVALAAVCGTVMALMRAEAGHAAR
jgi:hypothetical protein